MAEDWEESRADHLQWCKDRAMPYVRKGDLKNALASFISDMKKHTDTRASIESPALSMLFAMDGMRCVQQNDANGMRRLIQGTN